eukprot:GHVU01129351.1.p2 GENE.GHVU01129351.1~~GHVU01129351.1.p2  ORF type:complete len:119 (+),score=27.99 GHVU01129351.1:252-608(+)
MAPQGSSAVRTRGASEDEGHLVREPKGMRRSDYARLFDGCCDRGGCSSTNTTCTIGVGGGGGGGGVGVAGGGGVSSPASASTSAAVRRRPAEAALVRLCAECSAFYGSVSSPSMLLQP